MSHFIMRTTQRPPTIFMPLCLVPPANHSASDQDKIQVTKRQIRGKLTTRLTQSSFWTQQSTESVTNSKQTMTNTHQNLHFVILFTIDQKHLRRALKNVVEKISAERVQALENVVKNISAEHKVKAQIIKPKQHSNLLLY